jgi:DNA excision repair protein ERCC-3
LITPGDGRPRLVDGVRRCAELRSIVAGNYLYEVTPSALWGSAARGFSANDLLNSLERFTPLPIPSAFTTYVSEIVGRYGVLKINEEPDGVRLFSRDRTILAAIGLEGRDVDGSVQLDPAEVGPLKLAAAHVGWPIVDERQPRSGTTVPLRLRESTRLRSYQRDAIEAMRQAGSGLVLLPCGAGKTVVGIGVLAALHVSTLILTPSRSVAEQWRRSVLDLTTASSDQVALLKRGTPPAPVSIATYHAATRGSLAGELLDHPWGLVVYDEVQSLPASVFRLAAAFQSTNRLGLTATLVREDGREREVFALVGPVVYDVPWIELEAAGWIAPARCTEVRVPAAESPATAARYKLAALKRLLALHRDEQVLVLGSDLESLRRAARLFEIPLVTGDTAVERRAEQFEMFRTGAIRQLALSKIGSVGIDLPNATVLIQLSGTFGSRQEEAQRLGRLLRPQPGKEARFYSLVNLGGDEERHARRRQRFLVDQGYEYELLDAGSLARA